MISSPEKTQKISYFQKSNSTRLSNKANFCDTELTEDLTRASQQLLLNILLALLICKSQIFQLLQQMEILQICQQISFRLNSTNYHLTAVIKCEQLLDSLNTRTIVDHMDNDDQQLFMSKK